MIKPPQIIVESFEPMTIPAPELDRFVREALLNGSSPLANLDHEHLADAKIGFLWTNIEYKRGNDRILGLTEEAKFRCGRWQKGRQEQQILEWFGAVPDFLITLDAIWCVQAQDADVMALLEHELYHCGQKLDGFGVPKFSQETGLPLFELRRHDVEEFIGVVRRYGVGHNQKLAELVECAQSQQEITGAKISHFCGSCQA